MKLLNIPEIIGLEGVFTDGDWIESKDQDPKGSVRLIQLADIGEGQFLNKSNRRLTKEKAIALRCTFLRKGDILLARMPDPLGRCCLFPGLEEECITVVDVCVIRTNDNIGYNLFIMHLINAQFIRRQIEKQSTGTTRRRISRGNLRKIKFPIPPLDDQIRIAHLLSKVEGLITQRKQHLQQLDDLLKSVFLEMFGDPVRNEKEWELKKLPQLVAKSKHSLKRGPFGGALKKEIFIEKGYLVYEQNHALNNDYSFGRYFIDQNTFDELKAFEVKAGDILISCSGVYLGKLSIVPEGALPGIINQALLKVTLNDKEMNRVFFVYVFSNPAFQNKYIASNRGSGIPNLPPMPVIKSIGFVSPPLPLQNQFAAIVEQVEGIKPRYQQSLSNLENLYGALSQKAFKGELDLSRVPLPPEQQGQEMESEGDIESDQSLPEEVKETLANLNVLNKNAAGLKEIAEAIRLTKPNLPQFDAVKVVAELMAALQSPLQELKQMNAIAQGMETAQEALKPLNLGNLSALAKSADLARAITLALPKVDFGWLEPHHEILRRVTEPFEIMRKAMAHIAISPIKIPEQLVLASETAKRLQSTIPDFHIWQQQTTDVAPPDLDDEEGPIKRPFTREDVTAIFAQAIAPLSFDNLLAQLGELEKLDLSSYETIRGILFALLEEQKLIQDFDEEEKTLLLMAAP